ncbi:hypothetical protein PIB30_072438 [Stylosanthes scabra]|uniref:Uncharacterized protein n=1 Tax=Stylosanthes scabra TaxID=79078 RepID=A0ABU6RQB0_9FABA|nr:hypothetical protein [Stylosanthes scabra]
MLFNTTNQSNGYGDAYYGYEDPSPRYPSFQNGIEEALQLLVIQSANNNFNNSSIASQPLNSGDLPSKPLSNPRGSIPTLFRCANQERREEALQHEDDVESLNHEEVHECLEELEEENEDQEVEDIDQEVEDKDKEPKGMEIVHSTSSKATPHKLPSELHFEWVNPSDMNFFGPQHYGLLETDGQLKVLCGVLDKKEMDSLELDESRFITCGKSEFKAYGGHLHMLHNNRAKVGTLSLRKHLGPWQFQEKLVGSQNSGWTNQVWDPGKSYKSQHFWGFITCLGILANLIYMIWNPIKNTKSKHWWGFIASIEALRSLVHATWDTRNQCKNKNWWRFQEEFKHKPP